MDFRRIESIFLIVFIGLNIFLGISYFQNHQVSLATTRSGNSEIMADIRRDQIKVPKLSKKAPTGGYLSSQRNVALRSSQQALTNQTITYSGSKILTLHSQLVTPETVKRADRVRFLKNWVKTSSNVRFGDQYEYAPGLSSGNHIVFAQNSGKLVYDRRAQLVFSFSDSRLIGYTQTYIETLRVLRSNVSLCSEQDAIITLYRDNELTNNAKVVWTKLAYSYLLDAKGSTVYVPMWLVGVQPAGSKTVTIKHLNAITKTVVKTAE
ncbi:two-component system regulatory protein YycI [Lacticaseibacillus nasuensis]|uniref:Regulatory protein YycH-like domain-containing protein n=1 Tax=Lacticaseibacillus nasuensis JCM 17158 TaxID=1291734 RepID=A0A0R1JRG3_9LACO|nr:two-component system regulatory protein YycI [Lacticaseibacillus nasuensis]KRK73973.1 hypothetical protein FD02_GL001807 [Lacticaseibacillus nasuensis JCM 17158]